jgi:hypothetical protein
LGSDAFGD